MEPPSYEEASLQTPPPPPPPPPLPPLSRDGASTPPPPSYYASLSSPPTPPPTYGEAVTNQPDLFPVLSVGSLPAYATPTLQDIEEFIHPTTQVGVRRTGRPRSGAVQTQPAPVPVAVSCLRDAPALVRCPSCHQTVTSKTSHHPSSEAWCLCATLALMGLFCGFCLIPLVVRGLQDVQHSCPQCGSKLFVYKHSKTQCEGEECT